MLNRLVILELDFCPSVGVAVLFLPQLSLLPKVVKSLKSFHVHFICPCGGAAAEWVRALDWRPGGPGFEHGCGNFASELGNSVYPALPVSFGGDTKSRRSLLSGVYARGSKISH